MKSTKQKQADIVSKYQKFEPKRVHRRELKNAPYNPRRIDEQSRTRLKAVIKKVGLVEPPTWNVRTGNIVSGHQRINILDSLHKSDDYYLDVSCVDLDEKSEVEANIALNNDSIHGEYDIDMLADIGGQYDIDYKSLGFTDGDLDLMFAGELSQLLDDTSEVQEAKGTIGEIKKDRKKAQTKFKDDMSGDFYFVVVCESERDKEALLKKLKVPIFETYIGAHKVREALG